MPQQRGFLQRVGLALTYRWLQVLIATATLAATISGSALLLVPKAATKQSVAKAGGYKYMHCDTCNFEIPYVTGKENTPAVGCKCKKPIVGYWVATLDAQPKAGETAPNPRKWFYTAVLVEGLLYLVAVYALLARPVEERKTFVLRCLGCRNLLQYKKSGFGVFVQCPTCDQVLKLPDEDEAMTMDEYEEEVAASTADVYEAQLRAAGYLPSQQVPPADPHSPTPQP